MKIIYNYIMYIYEHILHYIIRILYYTYVYVYILYNIILHCNNLNISLIFSAFILLF